MESGATSKHMRLFDKCKSNIILKVNDYTCSTTMKLNSLANALKGILFDFERFSCLSISFEMKRKSGWMRTIEEENDLCAMQNTGWKSNIIVKRNRFLSKRIGCYCWMDFFCALEFQFASCCWLCACVYAVAQAFGNFSNVCICMDAVFRWYKESHLSQ